MKDKKEYAYGIDFGTTNTAVIHLKKIDEIIETRETRVSDNNRGLPIPSVVAHVKSNDKIFFGMNAKMKQGDLTPEDGYFSSVKMSLDQDKKTVINSITWNSISVAAMLFHYLKHQSNETTGDELVSAVVAIPVGFSAENRKVLRIAAKNAGIEIEDFVNESTMAYFANREKLKGASNVVIFDWGGGTLDISILYCYKETIEEIDTDSMNKAGDKLDLIIAKRLLYKIMRDRENKVSFEDLKNNSRQTLLQEAEKLKIEFSQGHKKNKHIFMLTSFEDEGLISIEVTYDEFLGYIEETIDEVMNKLRKTIERSKVGLANIDAVVLVGGSSRLHLLKEKMEEHFGQKRLIIPNDAEWNIALGAALLSFQEGRYLSNQSIGIELADGSNFPFLSEGTSLKNWKFKERKFVLSDSSQEARFIFTGSADINESSEKYRVLNVPSYRFLNEAIIVDAEVDQDRMFVVKAKSERLPEGFESVWKYPNLKCKYELPNDGS